MKKILSLFLSLLIVVTGCSQNVVTDTDTSSVPNSETINDNSMNGLIEEGDADNDPLFVDLRTASYIDDEAESLDFSSVSDAKLLNFMESAVYNKLTDELGEDIFIENVDAIYISQEYIDELTYNSRSNIFFGYTLEELNAQFAGQRYVFTVEDGKTVVKASNGYDDTYYQIIRDVAIGTGVILLCVTVSIATAGAAPAVSMIFAMGAKSGAIMATSSGLISGVAAGLSTGIQTGDWNQALTDAAVAGSEAFKVGAICGTLAGGAGEAIGLHGATLNGLSMNEAAIIQRESRIPLNIIKEFQSFEQYEIIRDSGMYGGIVDGAPALIRDIDLNFIDEMGRTNLQRMEQGLAALDPETGLAYELHHMGQTQDATMAILTQAEHRGVGHHAIWHDLISDSVVDHGAVWTAQREAFWKSLATLLG